MCAASDMMMASNLHCMGCGVVTDNVIKHKFKRSPNTNQCQPKICSTVRMLSICPLHTSA